MQDLRYQLCRGKLPLGARVDARATWRLIRRLMKEGYKRGDIAIKLGLKRPILEWDHQRVTVATAQRLAQFFDAVMAEGPDLPVEMR